MVYTAVTQLSPVRHKSALCQLVRLAESWGFYGCMNTQPRKHRILFQLMLTALLALSLQAADAGSSTNSTAVRLEDFEVRAQRLSALTQALTDSSLAARQPQSVLTLEYISNNVAPTADYATIAALAPSVVNIETNGPGLSEAKHTTIRGIDDGGYNVTYDGIPFGDYNTFTHHTTSYFPAKLIGKIVVDRGPGTASTIGNATFGGTMALYSKDPRTVQSFVPTLSQGSYHTQLAHFEANTGDLAALGGGSAIFSYQRMTTDGFRTGGDMARDTYNVKYLQPIGRDTTLTLLSSINRISFGNPGTVTQSQIDLFGRNFGLKENNEANKMDLLNRKYNYQDKKADFEYIGIESNLSSGWHLENKVYTYSYNNNSHEKPKAGSGGAVGKMLGSVKLNEYRTYGDSFLLTHESAMGIFKTGFWYDKTKNHRHTYGVNYDTTGADAIDLTADALYKAAAPGGNPLTLPGQAGYNYKYLLLDQNTTFQAFAEYLWQVTAEFNLNAGVKYQKFTRDIDAIVNQTSGRQALMATRTDKKATPSLTGHYTLTKDWSAYAEIAQGFQSPSEANSFYVDNSNLGKINIQPQISTNYQIGTVFKQDRFNADFNLYYIDFKNYAYSGPNDSSGDPTYYGIAQGAYYSGAEAQATFYVGSGMSAYANGSINNAVFKGSKLDVPTVPTTTAALGLIFDQGGFFGSYTKKYVGNWAVYDKITNPDVIGAGASRVAYSNYYWLDDVSIGYGQKYTHGFIRSFKVRFQVGNIFDRKIQVLDGITSSAASAYTGDVFNVLPGRNYFLTLSAEF